MRYFANVFFAILPTVFGLEFSGQSYQKWLQERRSNFTTKLVTFWPHYVDANLLSQN
jgi:hypothetical protein